MKQYTIEDAYTGNVGIRCYNNGKEVDYEIVNDYNIQGYCSVLENQGYTRAYDVKKYQELVNEAEENLKWAIEDYERALNSPLITQ